MNAQNSPRKSEWKLDPRLKADTIPVAHVANCTILLMNDQRWPWLIIVPQEPGAEELHDLNEAQQDAALKLAIRLGEALKSISGAEKINTASIGNIVRQLHIHVVARSKGDANWPAPVWGYGASKDYSSDASAKLVSQIQTIIKA